MMEWKLGDPNRTFSYMLPAIGNSVDEFRSKLHPYNNFVNCFGADENYPELKNHVFILYKFKSDKAYAHMEMELTSHPQFVDHYEPNANYTMYIFEIESIWEDDIKLFREGKYSQMSDSYKKHILKFHKLKTKNPIYGTLYRKEFRYRQLDELVGTHVPRTQEASSIPEFDGIECFKTDYLPKSFGTKLTELEG